MSPLECFARRTHRRHAWLWVWLAVLLVALGGWPRNAQALTAQGPGGPILVLTAASANNGDYYAEILRNEGFNAFAVADVSTLSAATLANYDVVLLAKASLSASQVSTLTSWVNGGGNLIAMAPDAQLASLLGLSPAGTTLANAYLAIDTGARPGNGIVGQTMQFHGSADRYALAGATAVAMLYSDASTPTTAPAVTWRAVGAGRATAFTFDLATSIVQTRQGNPAWATQERDGFAPIRSDDKFYGNAATDPRADWIDLAKVAIPQADEQQRLLANLILQMNEGRKPLPRFWYFPQGKKAVVVMTGDDHGNGGTAPRFDQFKAASPAGCSLADWQCVRGTSYIYPQTPLSDAQAAQYTTDGFEVGLHVNTDCADYSAASLDATYNQQLGTWQSKYTSLPAPATQRHHCIVWSDWSSGAQVQLNHGMRLDTSYYNWPPSWVNDVPGLFNGTAMPMRFSDPSGTLIDVFMATSQMTDESGQSYPFTVDTLLDRALGSTGYYGAYTVNAHTDVAASDVADAVIASAKARAVPVVSAKQLLTWLDARNASSFGALAWNGNVLSFNLVRAAAANGLQAMLPLRFGTKALTGLTRGGAPVGTTVQAIKGVEYAFFDAAGGSHAATYATDASTPTVVATTPADGASGISVGAAVTIAFNEAMDPATVTASTVQLRDAGNALVAASVAYDAAGRSATLKPSALLQGGTTYKVQVLGGNTDPRAKDVAGNPLAATYNGSFTTTAPPVCPCTAWSASTVPGTAAADDVNAVELGVRFTTNVGGFVTGVRFYKGAGNTGTHVGNLWSSGGQRLATATFSGESASGWQQVDFTTPVAVSANTVYTVSYHAPNGHYAADGNYFASNGVQNGPVTLLSNGAAGGNGVYAYGAQSSLPASSYQATNYWVDVVFNTSPPADTTPPTVTSLTPANGSTGVAAATPVRATFSEAVDAATVSASTFELRNAANALVAATVGYDAATKTATLTPNSPLAAGASYTATVRGGGTDPRVKDVAGNALAASVTSTFTIASGGTGGGCSAPANAVVAENCLAGNPAAEWDIAGAGDPSLQGFATQISVNRGQTVSFKVKTTASSYGIDIYRLGWYGGLGARKVASITPSAALPQNQPACLTVAATGLVDCGNWAVSGSWAVPAAAASGIYIAKLVRPDTGGSSHIVFIVRDDAGSSALLFQTSDTTWQAYNNWGGNSLYEGGPGSNPARAYKVSYNRPFNTRAVDNGQDWVFNAEYPMLRWLEANGYDVSYTSGSDVDQRGNLLPQHRAYLSVGHDEYWSAGQRASVEAARAAGVNLAFFSGNEIFWKTRWEPSIDASATPYRTLVSYKETSANAKIDPNTAWTGTWRDPRFSPPADGGRPENALSGTLYLVNDGATTAITVPAADGKMRFWRNTAVASLAAGSTATLTDNTLGYEWDVDADNGSRPAGTFRLSTTTVANAPVLLDYGSTYGSGTATHSLTFYRHASGARVFGAGTVQWSWGLDGMHDRAGSGATAGPNPSMRQATVNLFADLGVQPATLQSGLTAASASTDSTAPVSTLTAPAAGSSVSPGSVVTISGTASDTGGAVAGVEVSVDNGTTWHPATGRASWTYRWTPQASGSVTLRSRAVDDSGLVETPSAGRTVTVQTRTCPCSLWPAGTVPSVASDPDGAAVTLGVRFTSDQSGTITGIRFYKGSGNTGTHVGRLWSSSGQLLASGTFRNETGSGWQQLTFTTPVAITANTVYVASYYAPAGHYAADTGYFATTALDNPPLHALRDGAGGANGVYRYGTGNGFPSSTYGSTNYWVDVVFKP